MRGTNGRQSPSNLEFQNDEIIFNKMSSPENSNGFIVNEGNTRNLYGIVKTEEIKQDFEKLNTQKQNETLTKLINLMKTKIMSKLMIFKENVKYPQRIMKNHLLKCGVRSIKSIIEQKLFENFTMIKSRIMPNKKHFKEQKLCKILAKFEQNYCSKMKFISLFSIIRYSKIKQKNEILNLQKIQSKNIQKIMQNHDKKLLRICLKQWYQKTHKNKQNLVQIKSSLILLKNIFKNHLKFTFKDYLGKISQFSTIKTQQNHQIITKTKSLYLLLSNCAKMKLRQSFKIWRSALDKKVVSMFKQIANLIKS